MNIRTLVIPALLLACSGTQQVAEAPSGQPSHPAVSDTTVAATQPDANKCRTHLDNHISYPASRADILAACANTPEFTDGEKRWISEHLPEGDYASASEVAGALGI